MKIDISREKIEKYSKPVIFAVLALISLICVLNREPWRDEAQAWLISRDCGFFEMFVQMRYEGHPALWQLVMFPFSHIGAPFYICYVINSAFYLTFLYLVLYKCPLPLWQRAAGVCACPVFVYSFQARSYMLMFLLLAACAVVYPVRREKPVLFAVCVLLLANTHVYAVCAAGGMFLCALADAWEEKFRLSRRGFVSLAIMLSGFILFLVQVVPSLGKNKFVTVSISDGISIKSIINGVLDLLEDISQNLFITYGIPLVQTGVTLFILLIMAGVFACLKSVRRAAVYLSTVILPILVMTVLYGAHVEILLVFFFFAFWIMTIEKCEDDSLTSRIPRGALKGITAALCIMILMSLPHAKLYIEANNSKERLTSGSIQVAEFLNENNDSVIVAEYPPQAAAFAALLDNNKKVWYSYTRGFGSFVSWSEQLRESVDSMTSDVLIENIENNFEYGTDILVVLSRDVPRETSEKLVKVFETVNCYDDESFEVYRFIW